MAVDPKKLLPSSGDGLVHLAVPTKIALPTAKIIPNSTGKKGVLGVANIINDDEEEDKSSGVTDQVKEDVLVIKETTVKIEKIVKKSVKINLQKIRLDRRRRENEKRKKREDEGEAPKEKKKGFGMSLPLPKISLFERLKNFLGTLFVGWLAIKLIDFIPQMMQFIEWIKPVTSFIGNFVSGLLDKLVSFIDFGYTVVDKVESGIESLFGEDGKKKFNEFQSVFTKFMNLALIGLMIGASTGNDLRKGGKFNRPQRVGFDRSGRRVTTRAQQRYRQRFGDRRFNQRFGSNNARRLDRLAGNVPRGAADPLAGMVQKGVTKVAGKTAGKIAGKIPIVGPLIDFGIRAFIFKEPLGKAAAGAVGAGVGQALGTWLGGVVGGLAGSVVPIIGNLLAGAAGATLGGLIGGVIGDQIGVSLYNVIAGKEGSDAAGDLEKKAKGGTVGSEEAEDQRLEIQSLRDKIRKASQQKVSFSSSDDHIKKKQGAGRAAKPKRGNIFQWIGNLFSGGANANQQQGAPNADDTLKRIRKAVKDLRGGNSSIISKIMSMGIDLLGGKKPDMRAIRDIAKSLVYFFDAAMPAPMFMMRTLLQKLAEGGAVISTPMDEQSRLRELTRQVEKSFVQGVTSKSKSALNTLQGISGTRPAGSGRPGAPGAGGPNALPTAAGQTIAGTSNVIGLSGSSGTVAYAGREQSGLSVSYSPFAAGSGAVITSGKGWRRSTQSNHKGYDVGAAEGTPMYAYFDGEVTETNDTLGGRNDGGYGYWIIWKDSVHGAYHFFGHLSKPAALRGGAKFKAGALLAQVGGSGWGSLSKYAPHLHWEIAPSTAGLGVNGGSGTVDPGQWVNTHGKTVTPARTASTPSNTSTQVASRTSYEQNGTTIAVVEKTRIVRQPGSTSVRSNPLTAGVNNKTLATIRPA